jgi:hypothetical protein
MLAVGADMLFLVTTTVATLLVLQAPDSSIAGLITDAETGAPLAGAVISVNGTAPSVTSQGDGSYLLTGLSAGSSEVVVVGRPHYHSHTFRAIVPPRGTIRIDIALHPAPTNLPAIEVRAPLPARDGDREESSFLADHHLSADAVRSDPRLAEADPLEALGGGDVVLAPESPEGLHIMGGASDQVAYRLDGVPVFSPYHGAGTFSAWNPDALSHLDLSSGPGSGLADGLGGTLSAVTIAPAARAEMRGSVSSTQARSTFDGPLGWSDAGFLISLRSTFPGLLAHRREGSYVQGESSDWLAKLESPFAGGRLRLLGYGSDNAISAAGGLRTSDSLATSRRNSFLWEGQSFGADWARVVEGATVHLGLWSAAAEAGAHWPGPTLSTDHLETRRRDMGIESSVDLGQPGNRTSFRLRGGRSATFYRVREDGTDREDVPIDLATWLWSVGLSHEARISARGALALDMGAESWGGVFRVDPGAEFRWRLSDNVSFAAAYSRRHQFAQSLRNEESVVGSLFPADLFVDASPGGVPIASSDLGTVTFRYTPRDRIQFTGRAYLRNLDGLALVSPRSDGPFANPGSFRVGSGAGAGIAMQASVVGSHYGLLLSYGLQRMRLEFGDSSYLPAFSVTHSLETGVRFLPSAGTSISVAMTALFGRHGTAVTGPFEWEGCNLVDRGCEFAGSPRQARGSVGLLDLPTYLRLDLGLRKTWLVHIARRDAELALFGTLTNILDRHNVLTEVIDPITGSRGQVEMRPRSPLTIGLDWRY